jgi:hypothetical protein
MGEKTSGGQPFWNNLDGRRSDLDGGAKVIDALAIFAGILWADVANHANCPYPQKVDTLFTLPDVLF